MKRPVVYVTGSNGFIGRKVVEALSSTYRVVALLRKKSIPGFALNTHTRVVYGDMTDGQSLYRSLPSEAVIVNLAANPYHPTLSYQVNVAGTQNLVDAARKRRAKLIVHVSSQATKIKKQGVYAKTKHESDAIIQASGIPYVILKPSLVYGEGERGLFHRVRQLAKLLPFVPVFGDGNEKVSPLYIDDFARIVRNVIADKSIRNATYDVGSEKPITYNRLYQGILALDESHPARLIHIPVNVGLMLAWLFTFMPNPPIHRDNILGSTQPTRCNPRPLLRKLKYTPLTFAEGVKKMRGNDTIRIAVVGLGKMGTLHLSLLNTFENVTVAALVDTNKSLFNTIHSMGVEGTFYSTFAEALKHEKLDAAYIITPTFTHFGLLKDALAHNLHVFLEKPAFLNEQQLKEAKDIRTDRVVHVGYTLLYSRVYREVKKIIDSQKYGRILRFTGTFEHGEVFGPKKGWMFDKNLSGGGVLMNPGPHFFSLLTYFFGKPHKVIEANVRSVYIPGLDDTARLQLDYGRYIGTVSLSWSVKGMVIPHTYFEIQMEKAILSTDGKSILITPTKGKNVNIREQDIIQSDTVFDINPHAHGEAYYLENKSFIDEIQGHAASAPNTLKFAIASESIIFETYNNAQK